MTRILLLASSLAGLLLATQSLAASFAECAAIEDDRERLACFDEAARAPHAAPAAPSPAPTTQGTAPAAQAVPVPSSTATISGTPAATPEAPSAATTSTTPTPAAGSTNVVTEPVAVSPSQDEDLFGKENELLRKGKQQIESRIMNDFDGWDEDTVFELENGQVWKQTDNNATFAYRGDPHPVAIVKKGYFGSFRLKVEGYNKNVRVKRIK